MDEKLRELTGIHLAINDAFIKIAGKMEVDWGPRCQYVLF